MKFKRYKSARSGKMVWGFDLTIAGQRIRRGEFPTKKEAEDVIAALLSQARAMRFGLVSEPIAITLQELVDARLKDPKITRQRTTKFILNNFLEIVSGETCLSELTKAHLKVYKTSIYHLKASSQNIYLTRVIGMLKHAGDYFPELENWIPPKATFEKTGGNRERVLSPDEISRLLTALRVDRQLGDHQVSIINRREVYDLFRLVLLTAAREGELINLQEYDLSLGWKVLNINATKTQTTRTIPASDLVLEILRQRPMHKQRFFALTTKNGYRDLLSTIKRASKEAGIVYGQNVPGGWVFYDLRHTAATIMEQSGVPYSTVSAMLGHKRRDMTARYTHSTIDSMKLAVKVLENWCREIDGFCSGWGEKSSVQEVRRLETG